MARAAATRATCYRLNVGAVLVYDRNVVAVGYNGAPSGQPHCSGNGCAYFTPAGCKVVHAEINALERASAYVGMSLFVTHSPCDACARVVSAEPRRVAEVFFETAYRDPSPVQFLVGAGVAVYQLLPSGLVVDQSTGQLRGTLE